MNQLKHQFDMCVGSSLDDAWVLARRYSGADAAPSLDRAECWVLRVRGGAIADAWGTRTPLHGLALRGEVPCTVAARRHVTGRLDEHAGLWQLADEDGAVALTPSAPTRGILGDVRSLRDGTAVAYVQGALATREVFLFDGEALREVAPPPLRGTAVMHGLGPGLLVAGGDDGRVAIGDGAAWHHVEQLVDATIYAVLAVSPTEVYAAGFGPYDLWRWDGSRWSSAARFDRAITDLVAQGDGLVALVGGERLVRVAQGRVDDLPARLGASRIHAGEREILATDEDAVTAVADGRVARGLDIAAFAEAVADRPPLWESARIDSDPERFRAPIPRREGARKPLRLGWSRCFGESLDDAWFLAVRSEVVERPDPWERESIVGRIVGGAIERVSVCAPILEGLQRVPSGRLYVAAWSNEGGVWRTPPDGTFAWERLEVPPMQGLFALDDRCVMAWGGHGDAQRFFLFDGARFAPIPSPPGRVMAVHGVAPDWVVAVGHGGLVARWDGAAWHPWPVLTRGTLGAVHVVSADEMYATGPLGAVFEGAKHGWVERAPVEGMAVGVTKWRGAVYVGDPVQGLLRLQGAETVPVELPVWPANLHAGRDALLMVEQDGVAETRDMKEVRRVGAAALEVALRDLTPRWR